MSTTDREDRPMTTETITAEQLEAAPLGTTIIRGINGPADRITEVVAVKAGRISASDDQPWMLHGALYETMRRWVSDATLANAFPDDARLVYPARDEPVKASGTTVDPLAEWLAMNSTETAARIDGMTVGELRTLRERITSERDDAAAQEANAKQHWSVLGSLESRIISLAAI